MPTPRGKIFFYVCLLLLLFGAVLYNIYTKLFTDIRHSIVFSWPYTCLVGVIIVIIFITLFKNMETTENLEKYSLLAHTIRMMTFLIPILYVVVFVFGYRAYRDALNGDIDRSMKNIIIAIGLMSAFVFFFRKYILEMFHDKTMKVKDDVDDIKWKHMILQIACLNGFIDALTYAIFGSDSYQRDIAQFNSMGLYVVVMMGMVLNTMTWFRLSHECYSLLGGHKCEISKRQADLHINSLSEQFEEILFIPYAMLTLVTIIVKYLTSIKTLVVIDIMIYALCMITIIVSIFYWYSYTNTDEYETILSKIKGLLFGIHTKLNHEYVYYTFATLSGLAGLWWINDIDGVVDKNIEYIEGTFIIFTMLFMICNWFVIIFAVPLPKIIRPFVIMVNFMQLIDAIYIECVHYQEVYDMAHRGEHLSTPILVLSFLYWGVIEYLVCSLNIHFQYWYDRNESIQHQDIRYSSFV